MGIARAGRRRSLTLPGVSVLDAAFVLSVTGAAMILPVFALFVATGWFSLSAWLAYRDAAKKVAA